MKRTARPWRVLAAAAALAVCGCAPPTVPPGVAVAAQPGIAASKQRFESARRYVLRAFDVVDVVVLRHPEFSRSSVVVRADGQISLPLLDDVPAAGATIPELDEQLTKLFSKRIKDPEVSVILTSTREPMVYVLGKVARPGPVPFRQASTAAEAIANAGDMLSTSANGMVAVLRLGDDGKVRAQVISAPDPGQPAAYLALAATVLEPQDIVFVPERDLSQFARLMQEAISPLQSASGGATSVLNPWLLIKVLESLDSGGDTQIGVPVQ